MNDNLKKFLEQVSADEELCAKVSQADKEQLIAIAGEMGIKLTVEDFEQPTELSDDELDTISGGSDVSCACAMGGGGTKDSNDKTCACVLTGAGYSKNGRNRCVCGIAGCGYDT